MTAARAANVDGRGEPNLTATLLALGLLVVGLVHGTNALSAAYVHDDHPTFLDNPNVTWPPPIQQIFTTPWFGPKRGYATQGLSRPLVTLTYAVEAGLGLGSRGRHVVNLLLYGLVCGLVGQLIASLLRGGAPPMVRVSSMVAVVLFAAYPLHTSSVMSVSYRPELMACALALLASLAFLAAVRGRRGAGPAAALLLLAALWSKESAVTVLAPWAVWAGLQHTAARDSSGVANPAQSRRRAWTWLVVATLLCAAWLGWRSTWLSLPYVSAHDNPLGHVSIVPRLLGGLWLVTYAAHKLLWPFDLAPDDTFDALPVLAPGAGFVALGGFIMLGLLAFAVWDLRRARAGSPSAGRAAAAVVWLAAAWLPVSHLLFPSTVLYADRLLFLPSVAALGALSVLLGRALVSPGHARRAALALLLGLSLPWVSESIAEGSHWRSEEALFKHGAAARPRSLRMRYNLGRLRFDTGQARAAVVDLEAAHQLDPSATAPWTLLVQAHTKLGDCARTDALLGEVGQLSRQDDATRKAAVDADVLCRRYARAFMFGRQLRRVTVAWGRKVYVAGVAAADPHAEAWARQFHAQPATQPAWVAAAVYAERLAGRPQQALRRLQTLSAARPAMRAPLMQAIDLCTKARANHTAALLRACAQWPGPTEQALLRAAAPASPAPVATPPAAGTPPIAP